MTCEDSIQENIERAGHIDRQWDILSKEVPKQRLTERIYRIEDIFDPIEQNLGHS